MNSDKARPEILYATAGISPLVKNDELFEVCGAVCLELKKSGENIKVIQPFYSEILKNSGWMINSVECDLKVKLGEDFFKVEIFSVFFDKKER